MTADSLPSQTKDVFGVFPGLSEGCGGAFTDL